MTKMQFLMSLHDKLSGFPNEDVEERLNFYSEMIEDRMEEGLSEAEAVAAVGSVDEIAEQIVSDFPFSKIIKEKIKPQRRPKAWEILLLILGAPLWLPLLISAFAVLISLYASLWSVLISLWAVFGSVLGSAFGIIVCGIVFAFSTNALVGIALTGAGIICVGLSIFFFYGCKAATNGTILLTKKMVRGAKNCFMKKEVA